jgi:hypothetical protein
VGEIELVVDEGVVESRGGGIACAAGVENARGSGPVNCTQTHRTRLAGRVEVAAVELECGEVRAGGANGDDFGVGGGVVGGGDAIDAFGEDLCVAGDDGSEGAAAVADVFECEGDGALHEGGIWRLRHRQMRVPASWGKRNAMGRAWEAAMRRFARDWMRWDLELE